MSKEGKSKFKFTNYLKRYKLPIAIYILLFIILTAIATAVPILTGNAIEYISLSTPDYQSGIIMFVIILLLVVLQQLFSHAVDVMYSKYSNKLIRDMSLDCVEQAFKINSQSYANHNTGEFIQRIVSDPGYIINQSSTIINMVSSIVTISVVIIYVMALNWIIGLCIFALVAISSVIDHYRIKKLTANRKLNFKNNDKLVSIMNEIVKSERDIKTSGLEEKLHNVAKEKEDVYLNHNYKMNIQNRTFITCRNVFQSVLLYGILILGIVLMEKGLITIAVFMIIFSYRGSINSFSNYFGWLGDCFGAIKVSLGRMRELFNGDDYEEEKFGTTKIENVKGDVKFVDVSFNYKNYEFKTDEKTKKKTRVLKSETPVLEKVNFEIKPNTTVAFVGKSGSGKSTILSLVSKMLEVNSGQVLIDDVNIQDLDKETLRKSISLVNQFPYIFDMSIKDNLLLAKENATDEEIENALKDSFLYDFVSSLPEGVNTVVGESGIKLSGGQRQRLAIARALLRKTSIIIFDESTSSLDNFAQEHIKKCIDGLKGKSTIIIVAHRLSTIRNVDNIFFLENGKIVDEGSFDELYKKNKEFKNMFTMENLQAELEKS